jgi:hypothetical protein
LGKHCSSVVHMDHQRACHSFFISLEAHAVDTEESDRAGRVTQVVECLPSKHEGLSPNPNTTNKTNPRIKPCPCPKGASDPCRSREKELGRICQAAMPRTVPPTSCRHRKLRVCVCGRKVSLHNRRAIPVACEPLFVPQFPRAAQAQL